MGTLIDTETLAGSLQDPRLVLVDCRHDLADTDAGARAFAAGHLPDAHFVHLDCGLSDLGRSGHGRHPLPSAADFCSTMRGLGVSRNSRVVAYDSGSGAFAARLWWMLRAMGHMDVEVLDGGFEAWQREGRPLQADVAAYAEGNFEGDYDPSTMLDADALAAGLADGSLVLVDARAAPRFRGDVEPLDAVAGHVPGARNRPFMDNLRDGRMLPREDLAAAFRAVIGECAPSRVVHMCGSGVTACQNLLAMEHAGLRGSRLYPDSWSGWISDPSRPVATGQDPD